MNEELEQTAQCAAGASNELDGFAKRLAEWNSMNHDARALAGSDAHPRPASGLPVDLATDWIKRATCRSTGLARSIRSLERDLARQRQELLEAQRLERRSAIAAVVVVMRRFGITLEDLVGQDPVSIVPAPSESVRAPLPPPVPLIGPQGQMWMGQGRRPKWVQQFLAAGGQLDDLRASRVLEAETA